MPRTIARRHCCRQLEPRRWRERPYPIGRAALLDLPPSAVWQRAFLLEGCDWPDRRLPPDPIGPASAPGPGTPQRGFKAKCDNRGRCPWVEGLGGGPPVG